ncbi:MAG: GatB/YqeY domain-containing protein [Deltaproteobacteria bacterium]|nr:GatB/YqeY domain-containing protein [Deltaproteobacteria bacterium]
MNIIQKLDEEIKQAMKAQNSVRLGALRLIKTSVKNKEIELIHPLSEAEFFACLSTMVKQRHESIDQFKKGNRADLVKKEEDELRVIEDFLPKPFSEGEIDALVAEAVSATGAKGPKDMGTVMKALKEKTAGRADGKLLSEKVKQKLSSLS